MIKLVMGPVELDQNALKVLSPLYFGINKLVIMAKDAAPAEEEESLVHKVIVLMGLGDIFDEARRMTKRQVRAPRFLGKEGKKVNSPAVPVMQASSMNWTPHRIPTFHETTCTVTFPVSAKSIRSIEIDALLLFF